MSRSRRSEETVLMDADWYEDPLGRFDGRFFDGERWTERVSDHGVLAIDPDFPPQGQPADTIEPDFPPQEQPADTIDPDFPPQEQPADTIEPDFPPQEQPADTIEPDFSPQEQPADTFEPGAPAVAAVNIGRHLQASLMEESPARTVAVLDASVSQLSAGEPPSIASSRPRSGRAPVVWGLLALIVALIVAGLVLLRNDDGPAEAVAEPVELDSEQEARVQDLEDGGISDSTEAESIEELDVDAPAGVVNPGASFEPGEAIDVGKLRIVNGQSVLGELESWHAEFAADRGIELPPDASCWFGQLGGAAVQVAHCGPVGGSADSEYLYDAVPLVFEETKRGQIAQPVVDAVTVDGVLANALTLIGPDGEVDG